MGKIIKILGFSLIFLGIFIPITYVSTGEISEFINNEKIEHKKETKEYYALLEIPKIGLKREIFPQDSANNNVDKNLFLHSSSTMPDNPISHVIILGHSGNGLHAYFKNLYKLKINDIINLYYQNNLYTYEITEIEYQNKTGELYLQTKNTNTITLITCTKNNKNTQTIYYGELKKV